MMNIRFMPYESKPITRMNAEQQIWALEGYALAQAVMTGKTP